MGQKVNPHGLRVGVIKDWDSKWYAEKDFADNLVEDHEIRKFLKKRLYSAGISKIEIERASDRVKIIVYTAKPGVVIGKGGSEIEKVKAELAQFTDKKLIVDIKEVKRPDKENKKGSQRYKEILEATAGNMVPEWLEADAENLRGTVKELPNREAIDVPVDEMLIVELYSK